MDEILDMWSKKNKQEVMDNLNHSITSNETEENKQHNSPN